MRLELSEYMYINLNICTNNAITKAIEILQRQHVINR